MAGTIPGVCFVRCPTCLEILTEFADVPMYKCGRCDTILRARSNISTGGDLAVGSLENTSQNFSDSGSLNHELPSSGKGMISSSSELNSGREKAAPVNIRSSYPTTDPSKSHEKKSSEHEENSIEERGFDQHNPRPTDYLGSKRNDINIRVEHRESLKLSDMMEDYTESSDLDTTSEKETAGGVYAYRNGNIFRSIIRNSNAYDDASVSGDDGCSDHVSNNPTVLLEGAFARKKVMDSIDAQRKEAGVDVLRKSRAQLQDFPAKPSDEMLDSAAMMGWFDPKHEIHASKWRTSPYSENFHYLQNALEPEGGGSLRTLWSDEFSHGGSLNRPYGCSSAKLKSFEHRGMKILQKVGELRDELNEIFDKAVEGKARPRGIQQESITRCHPPKLHEPRIPACQLNRSTHIPFPEGLPCSCLHCHHHETPQKISMQLPPNVCCGSGRLCGACAMEAGFPPCCHESKGPHGRPNEKRQPVKQYCRPVFGGAPFVICHSCLTLLRLPVDFSTSRRRGLHKLQCGGCSRVLLFSYGAGAVPSTPTDHARHPPSEVDSGTEAYTVGEINPASDHINNGCRLEGPCSYSEQHRYGLSFSMSSSAAGGGEPPLHVSASETVRQLLDVEDDDEECEGVKRAAHRRRFSEEECVGVDSKGKGICINADHEKDEWLKRWRTGREDG